MGYKIMIDEYNRIANIDFQFSRNKFHLDNLYRMNNMFFLKDTR